MNNVIGVIRAVPWSEVVLMRGFALSYGEPKAMIGSIILSLIVVSFLTFVLSVEIREYLRISLPSLDDLGPGLA